jgi:hypothetical protein
LATLTRAALLNIPLSHLAPERQPDGSRSRDLIVEAQRRARESGAITFEWILRGREGQEFPVEITLSQVHSCPESCNDGGLA